MAFKFIEDRRAYARLFYKKNKEKIKEQGKKSCLKNKEKINLRCKKYRENNKEKISLSLKKYYKNNKTKVDLRVKKYRKKNKERVALVQSEWQKKNREKCNENTRKWRRLHRKQYLEQHKKNQRIYSIKYREEIKARFKIAWQKTGKYKYKIYYNKNIEKIKKRGSAYKKDNQSKINKQQSARRKRDTHFRLRGNLSSRLLTALKHNSKSSSTLNLLGVESITYLKQYLEKQFYNDKKTNEPMTWDNYGKYGWHIDHIRPCASFDLRCPIGQLDCFHYTNLQPLWAHDNLSKNDKLLDLPSNS